MKGRDCLKQLKDLLLESTYTVVFTGAGMSTESGLPDFRSKARGLWEKFNPDELANVNALIHNESEFTEFYRYRLRELTKYKPHEGHYILGKWEKSGLIKGIVTQNVDGFHHDANSKNVMELHGTFRNFHCHECHKEHPREDYLESKSKCYDCGRTVRPGIVLFGEMLPQDVFRQAEEETKKANLFIVLGSSLTVSPANLFPLQAKENGAKLVIINKEPTDYDHLADLTIQDRTIKEILIAVDKLIDSE